MRSIGYFLAAFVAALVLFAAGIGWYDLWPPDEPRYAEVAREMMLSGDYLAPHVNGKPYTEKPPLLFWAIALASAPFGELNAITAHIPTLLSALIVLALTFALAQQLFDRRTAWLAIAVLATFGRFWWQARTVQIDMLLTACLTGALYCFWRWHNDRKPIVLAAFYALIALAVYAKGPPGLVFPLLLIFAFYWKQREDRRKTHWILGTLAVIGAIALWLIPARAAIAGATESSAQSEIGSSLFRQTLGRFVLGVSHAEMPWYYLLNLPVDLLPWTLFVPYTIIFAWRYRRANVSMRLLLAWTIPALVFFSICVGKRALYLLPLYPAFAILVSRSVFDLYDANRETWLRRTRYVWFGFVALTAVAPFAVLLTEYADAFTPWALLITAGSAFAIAVYVWLKRAQSPLAFPKAVALHAALIQIAAGFVVLPAINPYKSAREFCAPMRAINEAGHEYDLFSLGFSREEYIFYSERFHTTVVYEQLDIELPENSGDIDKLRLQVELRRGLSRAMRDVAIVNFESVTPAEREALHAQMDRVLAESELPREVTDAFLAALHVEARRLLDAPERPKLVIVQEEDYKWLLPILNELDAYTVLKRMPVGSREMLLLANPAGIELYNSVT